MSCPSCAQVSINGVVCHEQGCPDAWRDETRECRWCGGKFKPESGWQEFCCDDCAAAYHGDGT